MSEVYRHIRWEKRKWQDSLLQQAYKDKDGAAVIETTWHSVVAFENKSIQDLDKIEKGSKLYVSGRVRTNRFTGSDGVERTVYEVVASRIAPCEDGVSLACEM